MPFTMICGCIFIKTNEPMDNSNCKIHLKAKYQCDHNNAKSNTIHICTDYRPAKEPIANNGWPLCVCGHIAQEHN